MKRKIPFLSRFAKSGVIFQVSGYLTRALLSLLSLTLRFEIRGIKKLQELLSKKEHPPVVIALWHNQFLLLAPLLKKTLASHTFTILMSKSRDGEIPAAFATTYHQAQVIRVGHQNRHGALLYMIQALSAGRIVVITPDGPRGPAHLVKPGALYLAQKAGALIYPMSWQATKSVRLNTWDRFCIPLPFSKITATFGDPFIYQEGEESAQAIGRLQSAMNNSLEK